MFEKDKDKEEKAHEEAVIKARRFIDGVSQIDHVISRLKQLEERVTWIERLLMTEGRELFSDTATHFSNWDREKDV